MLAQDVVNIMKVTSLVRERYNYSNIMTEVMIMSAANITCFYFLTEKQLKDPCQLRDYRCLVSASLKIGLFSTRNFDRIGYH